MSLNSSDIAPILVERIEACHPAAAHFLLTELHDWPKAAYVALTESGLLRVAAHAEAVACPGCDWQCHKRISVRKMAAEPIPIAYINCDEKPDHGMIFIDVRDRVQYRATLSDLASFIAKLLKLGHRAPRPVARRSSWVPSKDVMAFARSALRLTPVVCTCGSADKACLSSKS